MILRRSVRGMLPYQTAHGREAYKRLKVYLGIPKELEGKELEVLEKTKNPAGKSITLGEVSKYLGG
jgi:large subunit ribosomal protein L13